MKAYQHAEVYFNVSDEGKRGPPAGLRLRVWGARLALSRLQGERARGRAGPLALWVRWKGQPCLRNPTHLEPAGIDGTRAGQLVLCKPFPCCP